ncbi:MAG: HAD-IC family P-type ATPase [Bacteroidetes bacterium]|nr:HAD-IC family P-type ATPase [Bacteroidota bacterium]
MDDEIWGEFLITNKYRFGVTKLVQSLKEEYTLSLISGDNDTELRNVVDLLGKDSEVLFNQSPLEKLNYIKQLQSNHELRVMMVGDGLNDAGALKQSSIGLAVTDSSNNFTPSSDCIIEASKLTRLDTFLKFAKEGRKIILFSFTISAMYNVIGLYFAIQGVLSPVIAAILMPCSSITIILLTYGLTELAAYRFNLKEEITN